MGARRCGGGQGYSGLPWATLATVPCKQRTVYMEKHVLTMPFERHDSQACVIITINNKNNSISVTSSLSLGRVDTVLKTFAIHVCHVYFNFRCVTQLMLFVSRSWFAKR